MAIHEEVRPVGNPHDAGDRHARQLGLLIALARRSASQTSVNAFVAECLADMPDALATDSAMVHLIREDGLVLVGRHSRSSLPASAAGPLRALAVDENSVSGLAALHRKTIVVDRSCWPERTRNVAIAGGAYIAAATPLTYDNRITGTICVIRCHEDPFDTDDLALLESCAAFMAAAIEHARTFENERRRAEDFKLINDLGTLIAEQLDVQAVLDAGVRHLARIGDVSQTFLLLYDRDSADLRMVASNLEEHAVSDIVVRADEPSIANAAIRERKPIRVDTQRAPGPYSPVRVARFEQRVLLGVPLISRGQAIGAVILGETRPGHGISDAAVEAAVAVSNQLATAIVNARLYEDSRRSYLELQRAQERLVQRERLAALGELAASVAHEVRNPLGVIFNSLASLRKFIPKSPDSNMLLDIAYEEAERLNRIISDLLDFARPMEPRIRSQSLAQVIGGAIDAAIAALGEQPMRVVFDPSASLGNIDVDEQLFRQALINLLVNALQATPPDSFVHVNASHESISGRRWARVEIEDDGPGIAKSTAEQIFQPFFTTKAKGTGLGLAIVKRIAEAHHGEISFEPAGRGGARFILRVPTEPST